MSNDTTQITPDELETKLAAARQTNPRRRMVAVSSPAGILILGQPNKAGFLAYKALSMSEAPSEKATAADVLLIACAVDPEPKQMKELLDDYVALATNNDVQIGIAKLIGTIRDDDKKK